MSTVITAIDHRSPAERAGVRTGERLVSIGGHAVEDVLDYRFFGYGYFKSVNEAIPPVGLTFVMFRIMVVLGSYFLLFLMFSVSGLVISLYLPINLLSDSSIFSRTLCFFEVSILNYQELHRSVLVSGS